MKKIEENAIEMFKQLSLTIYLRFKCVIYLIIVNTFLNLEISTLLSILNLKYYLKSEILVIRVLLIRLHLEN